MIPRVHARGTRTIGLLHYLYGPGTHEEHTDPHLVAASPLIPGATPTPRTAISSGCSTSRSTPCRRTDGPPSTCGICRYAPLLKTRSCRTSSGAR